MEHGSDFLLSLFAIFVAAQVGAEIAQRPKRSGVVGEIAAGCVAGNLGRYAAAAGIAIQARTRRRLGGNIG